MSSNTNPVPLIINGTFWGGSIKKWKKELFAICVASIYEAKPRSKGRVGGGCHWRSRHSALEDGVSGPLGRQDPRNRREGEGPSVTDLNARYALSLQEKIPSFAQETIPRSSIVRASRITRIIL